MSAQADAVDRLRRLDIAELREALLASVGTAPKNDLVILAAAHKARYASPGLFTDEEREFSRAWLVGNGFDKELR